MKQDSKNRTNRIAKWLFVIATVFCAVCAWQGQTPLTKALTEAYIDAYHVSASLPSSIDSSLSEEEWSTLVQDFENQIDKYYSSEGILSISAKERLHNLSRSEEYPEYCVDHDMPYFHINYVEMDPSGERATIHYSKITWSRYIDSAYRVSDMGSGCTAATELVKQDGQWKVDRDLDDRVHWPIDSLYVRAMLMNYHPLSEEHYTSFEEALSSAEAEPISLLPAPLFFVSSAPVKLLSYITGGVGY